MVRVFNDSTMMRGDSPMTHDATSLTRLDTPTALALEVAFDGGTLTTDGGLPLLARVDSELGLCESLAACVPEWRRRGSSVRHSLSELVRHSACYR